MNVLELHALPVYMWPLALIAAVVTPVSMVMYVREVLKPHPAPEGDTDAAA